MGGLNTNWQAKKGEPDNTPDEILSMVKSLAGPPHRILLFLQQSSVEWCSSLWLDAIREIDPTFRRTVIAVSKFDNRLKVCVCFVFVYLTYFFYNFKHILCRSCYS